MNPVTVINPWYNPKYGNRPTLTYHGKCLLSHREVEVYWNPCGSYDYTYRGMAITQRAGMSNKSKARAIIDAYLDGAGDIWCCPAVAEHIAKQRNSVCAAP